MQFLLSDARYKASVLTCLDFDANRFAIFADRVNVRALTLPVGDGREDAPFIEFTAHAILASKIQMVRGYLRHVGRIPAAGFVAERPKSPGGDG